MTNDTFFALQRARITAATNALTEEIRRRQFDRASRDPGDHSPAPYRTGQQRKGDSTPGSYMQFRMRYD